MADKDVIVVTLDLETTGLKNSKAVQVAATSSHLNGDPSVIFYNSMCHPGIPISEDASQIHGIFLEDLEYAASSEAVITTLGIMLDTLSQGYDLYTSGYNSLSFDMPILGRSDPSFKEKLEKHIDVYSIVLRYLSNYGTKLVDVYENYVGLPVKDAHDAAADCLMTSAVLEKYLEETGKDLIDVWRDLKTPKPYACMPFGKHAGIPIADVPVGYFRHCKRNWSSISPDMMATLNAGLGIE